MSEPNKLVQAAAEAIRRQSLETEGAITWWAVAECALAAAFAALPECEVAIVEAANKIDGEGALGVERTITALAQEFGEGT